MTDQTTEQIREQVAAEQLTERVERGARPVDHERPLPDSVTRRNSTTDENSVIAGVRFGEQP